MAWLTEDRKYGHVKTDLINHIYPGSTEIERFASAIRELEMTAGEHKPITLPMPGAGKCRK